MTAPAGSVATIIVPSSPIGIGGTMMLPPACSTAFAVAFASSLCRYTDQMFGGPASSIAGLNPATGFPFLVKFRYPPNSSLGSSVSHPKISP